MTWKPISGVRGYEVSDDGCVRSVDREIVRPHRWGGICTVRLKGREIRATRAGAGYLHVSLGEGNSQKWYVHRLVADAFLPPDGARPQINHKNGIKADNRASNLERVTLSENQQHRTHVLGKRGGQKQAKLTAAQQDEARGLYDAGMFQREIAVYLGVSQATVWRCLQA